MIVKPAGFGGMLFVVLLVAAFSIGANGGADIAQNETQSVGNTTAELDTIPQSLERNISQNMSGAQEDAMMYLLVQPTDTMVESAKTGVYFGHSNPTLGKFVGFLSGIVAVAGTGYYTLKQFQQARGRA